MNENRKEAGFISDGAGFAPHADTSSAPQFACAVQGWGAWERQAATIQAKVQS